MNYSRFLDIQSWWEVPSIAYFCSLFRTAFNLLDFDIEELEEALLADGTEESASSLLTELIVRLLNGCLGNNDISAFNYQMYLRRLFRQKCQNSKRDNPFNTDIDFQFLPLRKKVETLYALCDFRLEAEDVCDLFKNLDAESLRVEPLGWDDNHSAYWYFYGTRLYREDILRKPGGSKGRKKRSKSNRKRSCLYGDDWLDDKDTERVWQVVCFTEEDWTHLTEKFSKATSKIEKELFRSLTQNFIPEIPKLFQARERLQRKRLLELAPRRTSGRVLQKIKQKEEERKRSAHEQARRRQSKRSPNTARDHRARRRELLRSKSESSDTSPPAQESSESSDSEKEEMKKTKRGKGSVKRSKNSSTTQKGEPPPEPPVRTGRKTNNSLACATGQILIPDNDEPVNSTRKKLKTSQIFGQTEEDVRTDMYKVLEQLIAHDDAWPFLDPVEEEYAPNYYAVIRRPMDLHKMEKRLDAGYYTDFNMFKADFKLIVNNCRLYNGQDNEYTKMVDKLQAAFDRLTEKYVHRVSSSDEEIAVEYQLPTPSRKHKLKRTGSPVRHKRKKRKIDTDETGKRTKSSSSDVIEEPEKEEKEEEQEQEFEKEQGQEQEPEQDPEQEQQQEREPERQEPETEANDGDPEKPECSEEKRSKESHRSKEGKGKKKRKGHHRHGKHSKNHKKNKSEHGSKSRHGKKQKHSKNKDREGKRSKKKKSKHHVPEPVVEPIQQGETQESPESSSRSRSASPLPSIHSPTPSPTELDRQEKREDNEEQSNQLSDPQFSKDKYDKIKERRRRAAKDAWESLFDHKQNVFDKPKQNLRAPEKEKNQKLKETIEKLKASNRKYKYNSLFNNLFGCGHCLRDSNSDSNSKGSDKEGGGNRDSSDDDKDVSDEPPAKKGKKNTVRNESASVALELAAKDMSKWFDDAPKGLISSYSSESPARNETISTEDADNSRQDDESSQGEKPIQPKKEISRKRPSSREPKVTKRREIQRTIDRLQPGKSKGNLLTNLANKNSEKLEESTPINMNKTREVKTEESSPKLSLGSVLPAVDFTLDCYHKFCNDVVKVEKRRVTATVTSLDEPSDHLKVNDISEVKLSEPTKKDAEVETDPTMPPKPNQEKATPNLSAWFKAFGTPKNASSSATTKKKIVEVGPEDKMSVGGASAENKLTGASKQTSKSESPKGPEAPNTEGGESPLPSVTTTPLQRRTSTGSSVSERSSFSQDLDSPRHQMSHNSPLLQSPASPRADDFQKTSYPIINGTVRAGFYQDTTSVKSSPEKSCSPREMPQSPYSPYSQHVYISNSVTGSATPHYFADHNKSPLPTYGQNAPSYYDASRSPVVQKPIRIHDDLPPLPPEPFPQSHYNPYSPTSPRHSQAPTAKSYSQPQVLPSPLPITDNPAPTISAAINSDPKSTHFPVKKRTYSEPEELTKKAPEPKNISLGLPKNDYHKLPQPAHQLPMMSTASVDDIALALSEKSEIPKLNTSCDTGVMEYNERHIAENREVIYNTNDLVHEKKKDITSSENRTGSVIKQDNVDMINMGYMNSNHERRKSNDTHHDIDFAKPTVINLGMNNLQAQKSLTKVGIGASNMTPAHSHERQHTEMSIGQNIPLAHHNSYDASTFSLNDIELANKKLYSCNTAPASEAIDYGNWKVTNQIRKADIMPSDYSKTYSSNNSEKHKTEGNKTNSAPINYNKNLQHHQYNAYNNLSRGGSNRQRTQELQQILAAELRIPNPRSLMKNDHMIVPPAHKDSDASAKNIDTHGKTQSSEKVAQNHPLVSSIPYEAPYSSHSSSALDTLRGLPTIPQMLERYTNDERYLSTFAAPSTSIYHDKSYQMFNKSLPSETIPICTSVSAAYSQLSPTIKDSTIYKTSPNIQTTQTDTKSKMKRKRTAENKSNPISATQTYHTTSCTTDMLNQPKTNVMPSAYNFGTNTNMALGGPLYGDNGAFSIEDFRNSTNQLMAANYMAAAVAHQQRSSVEAGPEKLVKPAHGGVGGAFPFMAHGQVRAGYPFVGADTTPPPPPPPLYQQYLQRHQEELLRQRGAQIMSLYSPAYPAALSVRPPPYDAINPHAWL